MEVLYFIKNNLFQTNKDYYFFYIATVYSKSDKKFIIIFNFKHKFFIALIISFFLIISF